jgi:3-methyladenine DNA glycosylase/8-oxoguanine DNA glycosylase
VTTTADGPGLDRIVTLGQPALLDVTLGQLRRGRPDPTHRRIGNAWLRACRTPQGPVLVKIAPCAAGVHARAWGPGAAWALEQLPALAGAGDDPSGFRPLPRHQPLLEAHRRFGHLRIGRTGLVFEALSAAIIEQKVTGAEAYGAFRRLVQTYGEPAPGPAQDPDSPAHGMRVPPEPGTWASVPSWRYLRAGLEPNRSRSLVRAARRAPALERTSRQDPGQADRALQSLGGIGAWTSAEVRQRAHGDPDAWSIGDYHIGKNITWALTGQVLDDDACNQILEPYRGHRYRVQLLLGLAGMRRPRRAPRMPLPTHTPYATAGRS